MKDRVGRLPRRRRNGRDNERIKRYVAKYTINPQSQSHRRPCRLDRAGQDGGPSDMRALRSGKRGWWFKRGFIAGPPMGRCHGSLSISEPIIHRPMWGALERRCRTRRELLLTLAMEAESAGSSTWQCVHPDQEHARSAKIDMLPEFRIAAHRGRPRHVRGAGGRPAPDVCASRDRYRCSVVHAAMTAPPGWYCGPSVVGEDGTRRAPHPVSHARGINLAVVTNDLVTAKTRSVSAAPD